MEELITKLAEAWGPSGYEHHVRELIRAEVEPLADEVWVDPLGNLICRIGEGPVRMMVSAHMDEIGVVVSHIDRQGFARFANLGGVLPASLLGSRVRFENGVIAAVGVENQFSKRTTIPGLDGFFLDLPENSGVKPGDPGAFVAETVWYDGRVISKTLDNRLGCAVLVETLRRLREQGTPHTVFGVFTVQEEVGSRGAMTGAYGVEPHLGIAIDISPTGDVPKPSPTPVKLGAGPAIKARDTGHIVPGWIKDLMIQRAEEAGIPYQVDVMQIGTTDAATMQLVRAGIPSGAVGIPARNVHTRSETALLSDIQHTVDLLVVVLTGAIERP